MKRSTVLVETACLVACTVSGCQAAQRPVEQRPIKEEIILVRYVDPPSTLAGMVTEAASVIVGRYTGASELVERQTLDARVPPPRSTSYTFQVASVIKTHHSLPSVGEELRLGLPGGIKEYPTHISRERDSETDDLRQNGLYVLFLRWNPGVKEFGLAWGARGVYDITDGDVKGLHSLGREHDGALAPAFLGTLRAAVK